MTHCGEAAEYYFKAYQDVVGSHPKIEYFLRAIEKRGCKYAQENYEDWLDDYVSRLLSRGSRE